MEKIPYIDRPLPVISMRQDWQPFSWRTLPTICARMSKEELVQLIARDTPPEDDGDGTPPEPTAARGDPGQPSMPKPSPTTVQNPGPGDSSRSSASPAKPQHRMKPPGQPNRPGSGGYNLEQHLLQICGWSSEEFIEVQNKVHTLAGEKLDTSISYQKQRKATLNSICETVKKEHPIARGFDQCWVTRDILKVHLKNTSEASRRRNTRHRQQEVGSDD
ncbi:hypothetical protein K438DRAFT_1954091 [Mycena galopus ATCC 62051]|nr:hypothetical protein K438DRAFT_1954088 [Mycena galopus ATCC 62051]KAF8217250.1 hypothetical protein K438DRAFT_1954091 [Mycena galopus ATCC 62051]